VAGIHDVFCLKDAPKTGSASTCAYIRQPPQKLTPQLRARVLERTRQAPPDGSTHSSLRRMAVVMKVTKNLIARIWKEADLKPHRLERYLASDDPQFEERAAAIMLCT
jgi:hypothetical protein